MTSEERKAYKREWQRKHRARVRQYRLDTAIREVIAEIEREQQEKREQG